MRARLGSRARRDRFPAAANAVNLAVLARFPAIAASAVVRLVIAAGVAGGISDENEGLSDAAPTTTMSLAAIPLRVIRLNVEARQGAGDGLLAGGVDAFEPRCVRTDVG